MPFWNPERQERVRKRIFKIKVILDLISTILKIGGVVVGGIGLLLYIVTIFNYGGFGGVTLIVFGFAMYLGGYMLKKVIEVLFGETGEMR